MKKTLLLGSLLVLLAFQRSAANAASPLFRTFPEGKILPIDSVFIQSFGSKLLTAFYRDNGNQTAWLEKDHVRKTLLNTLNLCAEEGLNPKEYALDKLDRYESRIDSLANSDLIDYDILLTLKIQKYVAQMSNGRLSPKNLYRDWDIKENKIDINETLNIFRAGDSLAERLNKLQPNHPIYQSLKKELQLLNNYPTDTIECISVPKVLFKNNSDPAMIPIKKRLIYWKDLDASAILDATFDEATVAAIKHFQLRHGIKVDGQIGMQTVEALNFSRNRRREQVLVNLERWKWFPRELGEHYFIINIPEYNLKIIKANDTIEIKRVVVGQIARKTPVLSSTFNNIILNPTWTVPPTILEEDLLPAALKNRKYFGTKNIVIYNKYGKMVSPWGWNANKYKDYRYVQSPGDENSLGNVKFNFPNRYSVYLHDTNHRDYFVKNVRSLSSGCIRLENPLPIAQYMLNDEKKWSMEKICEVIFTKKTTTLPLKEKINIHQLYWTAWMDPDGTLQFRTDIYNLDDELFDKLGE